MRVQRELRRDGAHVLLARLLLAADALTYNPAADRGSERPSGVATLDSLFQQFLRERSYLKNVSPKTRIWYETAWKTFLKTQAPGLASTPFDGAAPITRQHLNAFVIALRDWGVRPVTCNAYCAHSMPTAAGCTTRASSQSPRSCAR
jgi:hypothetical protein